MCSRVLVPFNNFALAPSFWDLDSSPTSALFEPRSPLIMRHQRALQLFRNPFEDMDSAFSTNLHKEITSDICKSLQQQQHQQHVALKLFDQEGIFGNGITRDSAMMNLDVESGMITEGNTNKYQLKFNIGNQFSAENIAVTLTDHIVSIHAKFEKQDGCSKVYREVSRQFTIPSDVDVKELKSFLTPAGVLKVEAPVLTKALPEPRKTQEIPILIG